MSLISIIPVDGNPGTYEVTLEGRWDVEELSNMLLAIEDIEVVIFDLTASLGGNGNLTVYNNLFSRLKTLKRILVVKLSMRGKVTLNVFRNLPNLSHIDVETYDTIEDAKAAL